MPISNKFHHFEGDGSVSSRLHFWRRLLWSAQTSEYDSRACWESFTPLLVMPLPALIRSFLHMLFFSATLERFWSLYCSNSVEDETKDDTSTKSRAAVINTVLRSKNLKAAVPPVVRPGVNVSKSTSLPLQWAWCHLAWQQLPTGVCANGQWEANVKHFEYHEDAGNHLPLLPFNLVMSQLLVILSVHSKLHKPIKYHWFIHSFMTFNFLLYFWVKCVIFG